ncbi:hypothetical protein ACIGXI_37715 [Kitasatospora aureofaciens]|uniref:hypothetical protein n=1 Tax=Kitasatospora aureofaciens TaxID=1894 RepID=UPI0037CB274E
MNLPGTAGGPRAARAVGRRLHEIYVCQGHALDRLPLVRLTTGAAVVRTVWHLPPGRFLADYTRLADEAGEEPVEGRPMDPRAYEALRAVAAVSAGAWALGAGHPAVRVAANVSFGLLQRQVVRLDRALWSYNSHLNVFLGLLSLVDDVERDGDRDAAGYATAVVAALQSYYAAMYLQSGLAKVVTVGWKWTRGSTLRGAWAELGTPLGKRLSAVEPSPARAASTLALVYELAFAPLMLVAWPHRRLLGLSSAAFHGAVKATMDISFWHLSWYSVPLFAAPDRAVAACSRVLTAGRRNRWAGLGLAVAGAAAGAAPLVASWLKGRRARV